MAMDFVTQNGSDEPQSDNRRRFATELDLNVPTCLDDSIMPSDLTIVQNNDDGERQEGVLSKRRHRTLATHGKQKKHKAQGGKLGGVNEQIEAFIKENGTTRGAEVKAACQVLHVRQTHTKRRKYGGQWTTVDGRTGKVVTRRGLAVTDLVVDKLQSDWEVHEAADFKGLFLMCALALVLCPTQSRRLSPDLSPALSCASDCKKFNWCALVLQKLMESGRRFASVFSKYGFASGCGGCTLFLAVFYLDRLARNPLLWGSRPRVKVWNCKEIRRACSEDKSPMHGDFGAVGVLDIAYGEAHPREARDNNFLSYEE